MKPLSCEMIGTGAKGKLVITKLLIYLLISEESWSLFCLVCLNGLVCDQSKNPNKSMFCLLMFQSLAEYFFLNVIICCLFPLFCVWHFFIKQENQYMCVRITYSSVVLLPSDGQKGFWSLNGCLCYKWRCHWFLREKLIGHYAVMNRVVWVLGH